MTPLKMPTNSPTLPWWTWLVPLFVAHLGTRLSLFFQVAPGVSIVYLPIAFGVVMIFWWGPRALLGIYVNAVLCAGLWGLSRMEFYPLYALPETLAVAAPWLFFGVISRGKAWLPDIQQLQFFLLLGLLPAALLNGYGVVTLLIVLGDIPASKFAADGLNGFLATALDLVTFALPLLLWCTAFFERWGWTTTQGAVLPERLPQEQRTKTIWGEVILLMGSLALIALSVPLQSSWFICGAIALWAALRFGINISVGIILWLQLLIFYLPALRDVRVSPSSVDAQFYLNLIVLYLAALLVGRAMSDIFAQRREQRANQIAREEAERLRQQLEREKEIREMRSRFVSMLIHDFRNPLSSILTSLSLLKDYGERMDDAQRQTRVDGMIERVARLNGMLEDVLTISKAEQATAYFRPSTVNLYQFLLNIVVEARETLGQHHQLQYDNTVGELEYWLDERLMYRALANLLTNAAKYSPPGTVVGLEVSRQQNGITMSISDQGIGIPRADLDLLFEPFFRASNVGQIDGTGLGLPIVKQIVDLHHGAISCQSEVGQGTTFKIWLPETPPA
jgi:two-component system, sensor histidine kinase